MPDQDVTATHRPRQVEGYSAAKPASAGFRDDPGFRDSVATIAQAGGRSWVFAKKPSGKFYNIRTWVSWVLLGLLFAGPFIRIGGHPVLLLNILERKFILFGLVFWPQDFYLLALALLSFIVFIVLFTSIFGRIWCGWACPQTIFLEMLFRKIEYLIEGDYQKQRELSARPWDAKKIFVKGSKLAVFYGLSFAIANTFLAYVVGSDKLIQIISEPVMSHIKGFSAIVVFSFVFFLVFARFREQVCHFACPYGRFQSVLVDNKTIGVTYDFARGEERASLGTRKKSAMPAGDCVDCRQCVRVCPEGIDIRNGIQLECIQCTACIDACDSMMDSVGFARGLIRYTSVNRVLKKKDSIFTLRHFGYSLILLVLSGVFVTLLLKRDDVETVLLRQPGTLYQRLPQGEIGNIYQVKIFNKTFRDKIIDLRILSPGGRLQMLDTQTALPQQGMSERRFLIVFAEKSVTGKAAEPEIGVFENQQLVKILRTTFISPENGGKL